jgi:hypothetical protein
MYNRDFMNNRIKSLKEIRKIKTKIKKRGPKKVKPTIEIIKGKEEKSEATLISLISQSGKRKIAYKTERRFLLLLEDINN